jgi:hypothetical protein
LAIADWRLIEIGKQASSDQSGDWATPQRDGRHESLNHPTQSRKSLNPPHRQSSINAQLQFQSPPLSTRFRRNQARALSHLRWTVRTDVERGCLLFGEAGEIAAFHDAREAGS